MKALNISFLALAAATLLPLAVAQEAATPEPETAIVPEPELPVAGEPEPTEVGTGGAITPTPVSETGPEASPVLLPLPENPIWECRLPSGNFAIGVEDIVLVSQHEYVIQEDAEYFEMTMATRSSLMIRFYYKRPLPKRLTPSPVSSLAEGKIALERAQALIASGAHLAKQESANSRLPQKRPEDVSLSPTIEFRLDRKSDVVALYQSAYRAWRHREDGLFQLGGQE